MQAWKPHVSTARCQRAVQQFLGARFSPNPRCGPFSVWRGRTRALPSQLRPRRSQRRDRRNFPLRARRSLQVVVKTAVLARMMARSG